MQSIVLTEAEIAQQKMHANTLRMAVHFFEVYGFLKIDNLFPPEFIHALADAYAQKWTYNSEEGTLDRGTQVSSRRYIVPIAFEPPFNDPQLYANRMLMPLFKELLGPHMVLGTLGAISALPGATDQHLHADYYPLFEENLALSNHVPPFAITFAVPLVSIDLLNGPTHIWAGSHRSYPIEKKMLAYPKHFLHGPIGSCYFWDYRTFHAGGSNHSDQVRSLLYMGYTRRWFKDFSNPDYFLMQAESLAEIPEEHRSLFLQCRTDGARSFL